MVEVVKSIVVNNGVAIIADINENLGLSIKEKISLELDTKIDFIKLDITKDSIINCISFVKKIF